MTVVASPAQWKQKDRFKTYRVRSTHFSDIWYMLYFYSLSQKVLRPRHYKSLCIPEDCISLDYYTFPHIKYQIS